MFYKSASGDAAAERALREFPCCPAVDQGELCNTIRYAIRVRERIDRVPILVTFHLEFKRCTGGLVLGDLLYTTTLLPRERVRIATRDRTSSFSYESSTQIATFDTYVASEESFVNHVAYNLSRNVQSSWGGSASGSTSASQTEIDNPGFFGAIFGSDPGASTTSSRRSFSQFAHNFASMAASAHHRSTHAVRSTRATSISAVSVQQRSSGESESHYEATSRFFENPNDCHAVTYLFHQIDKKQSFEIRLDSITVSVPATDEDDLSGEIVDAAIKRKAAELEETGIIKKQEREDAPLEPTDETRQSFERRFESRIPTDGVMVRACVDECTACEPQVERRIGLELERRDLENKLLAKQIELLEKHSDYRCCPAGEAEAEEGDD